MLPLGRFLLIYLVVDLTGCSEPLVTSAAVSREVKKTVIFAVGIEGSYHHYLLHIFESIGTGILCKYNPGIVQERDDWEEQYLQWSNSLTLTTHHKCESLDQRDDIIIHATESFPEGRPLTPHSFPNLRGFLNLNATGKIDLRLLYLNRDVLDASISALQRFKPKGEIEMVGKYLIMSMNIFAETIARVPHCVFSDSDDESTRLSNLQRLFEGIADPTDVQKAVEANPFQPTNHTSHEELAIRHHLESILGPYMKNWPVELTRGTVFVNRTKDSRIAR